jgi:type VI secretion system secreted protein Hcp
MRGHVRLNNFASIKETRKCAMAFPAYLLVKGTKQGQFKGESQEARRRDWMVVVSFTMDVVSPHDPATGQPSGRRLWKPVTIVKEWGAASPQGLTACATNELLSEVLIEFTKPNGTNEEFVYQTVTLTNAMITEVSRFAGHIDTQNVASSGVEGLGFEKWSFTFNEIQVIDNDGKTSFSDHWLTA